MTWEILLGLITLVGFGATIVKPIINLTSSITKLDITFSALTDKFKRFDEGNAKSHESLWEYNEKQDETLEEHSLRLHDLDRK